MIQRTTTEKFTILTRCSIEKFNCDGKRGQFLISGPYETARPAITLSFVEEDQTGQTCSTEFRPTQLRWALPECALTLNPSAVRDDRMFKHMDNEALLGCDTGEIYAAELKRTKCIVGSSMPARSELLKRRLSIAHMDKQLHHVW